MNITPSINEIIFTYNSEYEYSPYGTMVPFEKLTKKDLFFSPFFLLCCFMEFRVAWLLCLGFYRCCLSLREEEEEEEEVLTNVTNSLLFLSEQQQL